MIPKTFLLLCNRQKKINNFFGHIAPLTQDIFDKTTWLANNYLDMIFLHPLPSFVVLFFSPLFQVPRDTRKHFLNSTHIYQISKKQKEKQNKRKTNNYRKRSNQILNSNITYLNDTILYLRPPPLLSTIFENNAWWFFSFSSPSQST